MPLIDFCKVKSKHCNVYCHLFVRCWKNWKVIVKTICPAHTRLTYKRDELTIYSNKNRTKPAANGNNLKEKRKRKENVNLV